MKHWRMITLIVPSVLSACEPASAPPFAGVSPVSRQRAAVLFAERCAICHGAKGDGFGPRRGSLYRKPPDFRQPEWRRSRTSNEVAGLIRDGIRGSDMPAWPSLEPGELLGLAEYVLSLAEPLR